MSTASQRQKSLMKVVAQCAVADTFSRLEGGLVLSACSLGTHRTCSLSALVPLTTRYGTPDVTRTSAVLASGNESNRMQSEVSR